MQVVSQDGARAVMYKGVSLGTDSRGATVLSILTEGGQAYAMGRFADYTRGRQVMGEIIISSAGEFPKEIYYIPAE